MIENQKENNTIQLFVSYVVHNASWTPKYDIRVFGKSKSMIVNKRFIFLLVDNFDFLKLFKLNYYGLIKQLTGEDWNETRISLSTAAPSIGGIVPELLTQNVKIKPKFFAKSK